MSPVLADGFFTTRVFKYKIRSEKEMPADSVMVYDHIWSMKHFLEMLKRKRLNISKKKLRKLKFSLFKNTSIFGLRSGIKSMIIKFTNNRKLWGIARVKWQIFKITNLILKLVLIYPSAFHCSSGYSHISFNELHKEGPWTCLSRTVPLRGFQVCFEKL